MTNPNNAVGTNGAFGGRTSVNAFNDVLGTFRSRGILSGWGISASSGMTVNVGGNGTTRDVAVAEDANGNKTTINNISASPIAVTLDSAPASNSRYDAIVAYVDKPPTSSATQDNPECCGIIPVTGTAASTPAYPDDGAIRSAITADGASGSTAYYVVLGYILVASGTTVITSGMITAGSLALLASGQVDSTAIANGAVNTSNIANNAVTSQKIDWTTITTYAVSGTGLNNLRYFKIGNLTFIRGIITVNGTSVTRTTTDFKVVSSQNSANIFPMALLSNTLSFVSGTGILKLTPTANGTQFDITASSAVTYTSVCAWFEAS